VADGVSTLPDGLPPLTLGWGVIQHATDFLVQPNGPMAGKPWEPTLQQARFMLWWYAVDNEGRWLFHHGVRRLAKGSGKSPHAAVLALEELTGPVRLKDFDPSVRGGCVGKPVDMPLVQIAATAESQTANTMRMVRAMASKKSRLVAEYGIDVGKTVFYTPHGGQLEVITSSASAAEGAEVTFAIADETEHWVAATGGPALAGTLDRNLAKSSSRGIETANAWEPGAGSVAESTFDAWQAQQEGRTKGSSRILYDARIAPADTDLADEDSLMRALDFVYDDCFWVDRRTIKERIWDPRTAPDVSRKFYLNQPTATFDAWTTPMLWAALQAAPTADSPARVIQDGEDVVLFFDGSKSRDATGIVGCAMSDGHVFHVASWEPDPNDPDDEVPAASVDLAVAKAFERWTVIAFFADVKEWEGFVKVNWPALYGKDLLVHAQTTGRDPQPIAWDMRAKGHDFTMACELTEAEIREKAFTHDGNAVVARHVVNARRRLGRYGVSIGKESKDSPKKIDLAVCVIGARMVRRQVLASKEWQRRMRRAVGRGRVVVLD
jgi:plastocyanin